MATYGVSFANNKQQQELIRLIRENGHEIIFCLGSAGTGKTFASLAAALDLKESKKYSRIIYARNPIQVGADMGYLPGGVEDKYDPFMGPLYDNLLAISTLSQRKPNVQNMKMQIEIIPIAFLRGRSFDNSIIIIDEAQNLDLMALKTILTRVGNYSKIILLGSMNQIDDPKQAKKPKCDFEAVIEKLSPLDYVETVELTQSMRNPVCVEIDELLSEIKN